VLLGFGLLFSLPADGVIDLFKGLARPALWFLGTGTVALSEDSLQQACPLRKYVQDTVQS
jgi:hypothetical protein